MKSVHRLIDVGSHMEHDKIARCMVAKLFFIFCWILFYMIKVGASFFYIFAGTFFHIIKVATIFFIFAGYFFYIIKVGANFLCLLDTFLYYQGAVLFLEFPS